MGKQPNARLRIIGPWSLDIGHSSPPMSAPASRKPWPMRWIVLAILLFIVPYTYVTLEYRKPNKAFEPYADMKEQANVHRLLDAGYKRVSVRAERPFPALSPAEITRGPAAAPSPASPQGMSSTPSTASAAFNASSIRPMSPAPSS